MGTLVRLVSRCPWLQLCGGLAAGCAGAFFGAGAVSAGVSRLYSLAVLAGLLVEGVIVEASTRRRTRLLKHFPQLAQSRFAARGPASPRRFPPQAYPEPTAAAGSKYPLPAPVPVSATDGARSSFFVITRTSSSRFRLAARLEPDIEKEIGAG